MATAQTINPDAWPIAATDLALQRARAVLARALKAAGDRAAAVAIERVLVHHEAKPWSRQRKAALLDEIAPIPADLLEEATTEVVRAQVFDPKPADWWTKVEPAISERRAALRRVEAAIERKRAARPWSPPSPEQRAAGLKTLAEIRRRLTEGGQNEHA